MNDRTLYRLVCASVLVAVAVNAVGITLMHTGHPKTGFLVAISPAIITAACFAVGVIVFLAHGAIKGPPE